jgi:acyl-CoA synthetase (AMP-forming)/AMP-acid ligase II
MILTGGENVYPREVEEVLFEHPAVLETAVVGAPDPKWGEKVVSVVCLLPGAEASEDELIASYKKPKHVEFIEALPKNASGKVLTRELRDAIASGAVTLGGDWRGTPPRWGKRALAVRPQPAFILQ